MAKRRRAMLLGLYVALLAALSLLLWLALVRWSPAPLPTADGHFPAPAAPLMLPAAAWWRGDAVGIVGAYAAGAGGMLADAGVAAWRSRGRKRKPPAA